MAISQIVLIICWNEFITGSENTDHNVSSSVILMCTQDVIVLHLIMPVTSPHPSKCVNIVEFLYVQKLVVGLFPCGWEGLVGSYV